MRLQKLMCSLILAMTVGMLVGRAQGGAGVYVVQFQDLKSQLNKLAARADDLVERGTAQQKLAFGQDSLALAKLIHRLGEDASESNLRGLRQGREPDRTLLLVATAAEALSLEIMALDKFVDTRDRIFKATARDADTIAADLEKVM